MPFYAWKENAALVPCVDLLRHIFGVFVYGATPETLNIAIWRIHKKFSLFLCVEAVLLFILSFSVYVAPSLHVYCGAGMTKPFAELAEIFTQETHITVEVTYANAGQIQSQINTAQEGDFLLPGIEEAKIYRKNTFLLNVILSNTSGTAVPKHIQGRTFKSF